VNVLDVPTSGVRAGRAVGALLAFLHVVCGRPNPKTPDRVLWTGTVGDIRDGMALNADDPSVCPTTDDETVQLLHRARPTLRQHGFRLSPKSIERTSIIRVSSRPKGYKPEWERRPNYR